jgi:hypothetical protein
VKILDLVIKGKGVRYEEREKVMEITTSSLRTALSSANDPG